MLVTQKIARLVHEGRLEAALDHVLRNGRPLGLEVRARLLDAGNLPVAALGLALQRVCELTYSPSQLGADLAHAIAAALAPAVPAVATEPPALFAMHAATATPERPTPGAAAIALAGLIAYRDQCRRFPGTCSENTDGIMAQGMAAAVHVLFVAQAQSLSTRSPRERGMLGDGIDTALVMWQCGLSPGLRTELARVINLPLFERSARAVGADRIVNRIESGATPRSESSGNWRVEEARTERGSTGFREPETNLGRANRGFHDGPRADRYRPRFSGVAGGPGVRGVAS